MSLTLITFPSDVDLAWAEHAERQRIVSAYRGAHSKADRTAARWAAYEYDLANPGTSSLIAQLDEPSQPAAA
jgi:hypothetical protein